MEIVMENEALLDRVYEGLQKLKKQDMYVPAKSTKYSELEPKYYKLAVILKNFDKRREYIKLRLGLNKEDGIPPESLYELCREDPVIYLAEMRGIFLRPHQIKGIWLLAKDDAKYVAFCWGRRSGKTYTFRYFAEWSCVFNKYPVENKGTKWSILMHSKEIGREIYMEEVYNDIENADIETNNNFKGLLGTNFFSEFIVKREDKTGSATAVKLSYRILKDMSYKNVREYMNSNATQKKQFRKVTSNFKILTSVRGIEGNVICDEIAFWKENVHLKDTHKVYNKGVRPIVTSEKHLKCLISSTPDGMQDIFYKLFDPLEKNKLNPYNKNKLWFPCWVRTEPDYLTEMNELRAEYVEDGDLITFQQEYEAKFVKSKDSFFDEELHVQMIQDDTLSFLPASKEPVYIVTDWGGTNTSHTVISVVTIPQEEGDVAKLRYYHEYEVNEDNNVIRDIVSLTNKFPNWENFICDNKGGRGFIQQLEELLGEYRIIQFNFTTQKKDGYFKFKAMIRNEEIKIPVDKRIEEQMRNFTDKLKPNDAIISDDILDTIMMPCYYISQIDKKDYGVVVRDRPENAPPRSRTLDFNSRNIYAGNYGKYQ